MSDMMIVCFQQEDDCKILYDVYLMLIVEILDSISLYIQVIVKCFGGYVNEIGIDWFVICVES